MAEPNPKKTEHNYGELLFETKKSLQLAFIWTLLVLPYFNYALGVYQDTNDIGIFTAPLLILSPAIFMFVTYPFSKLSIYARGVVVKSIFRKKQIPLYSSSLFYINYNNYLSHLQYKKDTKNKFVLLKYVKIKIKTGDKILTISSGFKHPDRVISLLNTFQTTAIAPLLYEKFKKGETLDFEVIKLSKNGITAKDKTVAFKDVQAIDDIKGYFQVRTDTTKSLMGDTGFTVFSKKIPNLYAMVWIIQRFDLLKR